MKCVRARALVPSLIPESEFLNDLAVSVDFRPLHVIEEAATGTNHLEQAAATVMVLLVRAEMVGEVVDALREEGYLHPGRTGVRFVRPVLLERPCVIESHVSNEDKLVEPCNLGQFVREVKGARVSRSSAALDPGFQGVG